jgi:uncharacterized protein (DUF4415 family)
MAAKQQISFKIDSDVVSEFDKVLNEFKDATGMRAVRQEAIEMAMKEYIIKLRKQIEALKKM